MFNIYRIHFVEKALIVRAEDAKEALRRAVQYVDPQARVRKFVIRFTFLNVRER